MTDLRNNTKDELSLLVFNTEELYTVRHWFQLLITKLSTRYIFTNDQLVTLINDLQNEEQ